jgi:hypothetical protein
VTESSPAGGRPGRTVWAVVAGILLNVILSMGTDHIFHVLEVYPPYGEPMAQTELLLLALSYRLVYGFLGMYLTAILAPYRVVRLLWITCGIGLVLGGMGIVAGIKMDIGGMWYPIVLALSVIPTTWLVAKIYVARHGER